MNIRYWIPLVLILSSPGCGGGGGGDSTAPSSTTTPPASATGTTFDLESAYNDMFSGATFNMTGTASNGDKYSALFSFANKGKTTVNGQSVTQVDNVSTFTNTTTNGTLNGSQTRYYQANWTPYEMVQNKTGVVYTAQDTVPLPASAKIGDFGKRATYIGSDGSKLTGSWNVTSASGGNALLTFYGHMVDSGGSFVYEEDDSFTVTPGGNVLALKAVARYADGTLITVSGNRQ